MPEELWTEVPDIVLEGVIISKKEKCKKAKWLSDEALHTPINKQKAKEKWKDISHLNVEF